MSIARGIFGQREPVFEPIEDFDSKCVVSSNFFGDFVKPWNSEFIMDEFKFEEISFNKCEAKLARNVCDKLVGCPDNEIDYFCICVPCYNEDLNELETTILSLMENFEFMKRKIRFYGDAEGLRLQKKFDELVPVIVPIFDGMKAIHPSMRNWLDLYFEGLTSGLDGNSSEGLIDVRVGLRSWWYDFRDVNSELQIAGSTVSGNPVSTSHADIESQRLDTTYRQPLQRIASEDIGYSLKFPLLAHAGLGTREPAPKNDDPCTSPATILQTAASHIKASSTCTKSAEAVRIVSSSQTDTSSSDSDGGLTASAEADLGSGHHYNFKHDPLNRAASKSDSSSSDISSASKKAAKSATVAKSGSDAANSRNTFTPKVARAPTGQFGGSDDSRGDTGLKFLVAPIVKRSNHRKHNSHQWFFNSICEGLGERVTLAFLTDCGTSYKPNCLSMLTHDLLSQPDLIGCTARQRVAYPNKLFHPCEEAELHCLRGDHSGDATPCWKCYATYFLSPALLQGFEYEASLIAFSAIFNIVEVLTVMPGPCQLLNWKQMKRCNVVHEYFDLLFNEEENNSEQSAPQRPISQLRNKDDFIEELSVDNIRGASQLSEFQCRPEATLTGTPPHVQAHPAAPKQILSFTEFMRVNMRLAEDRMLSFVSVFCTGLGTKWVTGATFFYRPEIKFQTLLTQRRRWINGTFANFLFFFLSKRAARKVHAELAGSYKFRALQFLYGLQLTQMLMTMISPAIFASASTIGLRECGFNGVWTSIWLCIYLIIYVVWTISSFYAERGLMNEKLCWFMALMGFIFIMPIYISVAISVATTGLNLIHGLVLMSIFAPALIAVFQSFTCIVLYTCYLPWFLVLMVFFVVYMPHYSLARLFDTTWGNRATGRDAEVQDAQLETMKTWTSCFMTCLITLNVILACVMPQYLRGTAGILVCMFILLTAMFFLLLGAMVYFLVVVPLRMVLASRKSAAAINRSAEKLIMKSSAYMPQSVPLRR